MLLFKPGIDGFVFGLGLICSLGPQNCHVIKQGLMRNFITTTALIGWFSDIIIVCAASLGLGEAAHSAPQAVASASWLGVAFVAFCGLRSLRRATLAKSISIGGGERASHRCAIKSMLALTWLNPLFYLEVGVLCGLLAESYATPLQRAEFLGAFACASGVRFFGLSLAVRPFSNFFAMPGATRLFDRFSGAVMLVVATSLGTTLLAGH
jgi:L-lysine exporter family protein LysE/ArgO